MLNISNIRAITLDLDDTLWPIAPVILRAEEVLADWLHTHAPVAAAVFRHPERRLAVRNTVVQSRPDLHHDLSAIRRESIRLALHQAQEDTALAEPAFDVFFTARMQITLYDDAGPALALLAAHFPLVAVSNGNADVHRVGLGHLFRHAFNAREFGCAKPDARIFHAGASALGVDASAVLHVGDDAALDVLGALDAGMQTVWVNRENQAWTHAARPHATVVDLLALCDLLGLRQAPAA
jgi:HAD superfamily hydrolase (TIGR01549 family)